MPKHVIERDIPDAGELSSEELKRHFANLVRCAEGHEPADPVSAELRHRREDLLHLYRTERADGSRDARQGGFPAVRVFEVATRSTRPRRNSRPFTCFCGSVVRCALA